MPIAFDRQSAPMRRVVAAGAFVAAAAHIPVIGAHLSEAPYMGVLFIVLTVGCLLIAAACLVHDAAVVYMAAIVTCGLAIVGYVATRLVAFPMLADDVGNWLEPLGVIAILSEAVVVVAAVTAVRRFLADGARRHAAPPAAA